MTTPAEMSLSLSLCKKRKEERNIFKSMFLSALLSLHLIVVRDILRSPGRLSFALSFLLHPSTYLSHFQIPLLVFVQQKTGRRGSLRITKRIYSSGLKEAQSFALLSCNS